MPHATADVIIDHAPFNTFVYNTTLNQLLPNCPPAAPQPQAALLFPDPEALPPLLLYAFQPAPDVASSPAEEAPPDQPDDSPHGLPTVSVPHVTETAAPHVPAGVQPAQPAPQFALSQPQEEDHPQPQPHQLPVAAVPAAPQVEAPPHVQPAHQLPPAPFVQVDELVNNDVVNGLVVAQTHNPHTFIVQSICALLKHFIISADPVVAAVDTVAPTETLILVKLYTVSIRRLVVPDVTTNAPSDPSPSI